MSRTAIVIAAALALAVMLPAVSAQAQAPRTFVSAAGSDSNPCSFAAPCRHFQAAVNATSLGGEVDALDPAGYGPIVIIQAITIEGQGWSYIAPPLNGNAIAITAGPIDKIKIHGVSLNGAGINGGTNGIVFNAGGSLTVADCVAQNFVTSGGHTTGNGILIQPTTFNGGPFDVDIINTNVSNNGVAGIYYFPPSGTAVMNAVIDHVVATKNQLGIASDITVGGLSTTIAISNSIVNGNADDGIFIQNASQPLAISIDNTSISGNRHGITANATSKVMLGRSVITANSTYGVDNETSPNSFNSYQDNRINGNGATAADDVHGSALLSVGLK